MKKIILSLCAAAVTLGFTACGGKSSNNATDAEGKAIGDSLSLIYGQMMASNARSQFDQQIATMSEEQKASFTKAQFMRGLQAVANRDTADLAYILGVQAGLSLWGAQKAIPAQYDIPADGTVMIEAFEKIFNADSIENAYTYQMQFQGILNRAQEYAQEKETARLEADPVAIENKAKGQAYADSLVNNAGFTRAESGLVYKIIEEGTGEKVKPNDRIKLRYVGKHIDGTVFDQTREDPMTSYASRFIPGFNEGLQLVGKGGKAILVIPSDLGYGLQGQGNTIGLNETLVFDIEIEDIL